MQTKRKNIVKLITPKIFVYTGFLIFLFLFYKLTLQRGFYYGAIIASLPFLSIGFYLLVKNPLWSFIFLFIVNYFVMGITRYISFPGGILMDSVIFFCFATILLKTTYQKLEWKRVINPLTMTTFIWVLFCILELLNPKAVPLSDWATKVRSLAFYPFIMALLVPLLLTKYKHLKWLLYIWSVLTLIGAFKGYWQKNHGFDSAELYWLYVCGGARTHLINTGIRFFSFFTDAGNYGSSMGFSMVVFSTAVFFVKNKYLKIYFFIVAFAGGYGMMISGTRGAIAVPFAGYTIFTILSKNWKVCFSTIFFLASAFIFLNFTNYGDSNQQIRRMRTAFDQNDASLNTRIQNQKKLKEYMADIPFGTSIGFYGSGAINKSNPYYEISKIPSDSWYVQVWIQAGVIGLVIYLTLLIIPLVAGGYIILFKIKNKRLRGILSGLLAGVSGMFASAYGNDILGQFPNCFLFYICLALVFMGKYYDKELEEHEKLT